jgi:hypothetical protein
MAMTCHQLVALKHATENNGILAKISPNIGIDLINDAMGSNIQINKKLYSLKNCKMVRISTYEPIMHKYILALGN